MLWLEAAWWILELSKIGVLLFNQAASLFLSFFFPLECKHRPKVVFDLSTTVSPRSAVMPDTQ